MNLAEAISRSANNTGSVKMKLTSYGSSTMIKVSLISLMLSAAALLFPSPAQIAIMLTVAALLLFTLYFFRDPNRTTPDEQKIIVAPADGKIILVQPYGQSSAANSSTLISIFMSPLNVHVNRVPLSGKVTHLRYCPGQFMMAFDNKSMANNERMEIGIDNGTLEVRFSQISGFLARRIVCTLQNGTIVNIGTRFGMIKFGSRVDVILPPSATVVVQPGQRTRAGETVLARY